MALEGLHYIDGKDLYTTFGVIISEGSDDFLKFPKRKESITHDWGDKNGIDVDLSKPFFEAKDVSLRCALIATSKAEFWTNHRAFLAEMGKPGTRRLTVSAFEQSFYVFYRDCTNFERFTQIKDGKIACKFTILVTEQEPQLSSEDIHWIDDDGSFVIL